VAVPVLARGDAERLLRFVGEAESLGGDDPFTGDLLGELGRLVEADGITDLEPDYFGRHLFEVSRTGEQWDGVVIEGFIDVELNESPITPRRRRPFVHHLGDRRLIVERVGDTLLLEETGATFGLTTREREVLTWVARGKTNLEIARLLSLAPRTVSKHLENVYAKLGVKTRTAAVARFLGIDVEGGDGKSIVSAQS
jgi:DNA-binding CsgD family transcriptional regulator